MAENVERQIEIPRIHKVSVAKETFDYLLKNIMTGTWKKGEKIPSENELREALNVSRHTIRAAISNLNMLGLLETRRGEGNYVNETGIGLYADFLLPYLIINRQNVSQIIEFRESIEVASAYYAAIRATQNDIDKIRQQLELCKKNVNNTEIYPAYDMEFHSTIAEASKNELLYQSLCVIKKNCFDAIRDYFDESMASEGADYHDKIYAAICKHDADEARKCMESHMHNILRRLQSDRAK